MAGRPPLIDLAVVIPTLDKYGGAERFVIECISRWQHRHRITLYSTALSEALLAEHGIGERVRRVALSPYFEGQHSMLLNATLLPRLWRNEIGRHDLYHTHLWPTHLIDLHPMVWYPHEPFRTLHDLRFEQRHGGGEDAAHIYPKYDYDRFGERHLEPYLKAIEAGDGSVVPERIVANSAYSAGYLGRVYRREVTEIVYPGAELPVPMHLPRDPNLFVTVSQLWSHKRTRLLIEALALTDEAQLMVIGAGPDRDWLEDLAARLGVADRVFFMSGLRNSELALILERACAFLFAPIREPFGIVVLEAMAAGLPVIAANEGGYAEVCTPESAFLVPPFPSAFAEKMALLQADAGLRQRMGEAGRALAAAYSWDRTANELETILVQSASLAAADATQSSEVSARTLFGAQYYLWYGEGFGAAHWNDDPALGYVAERPTAGYYGSTKGETINRHLDHFEAMGLDYAILNLHVDAGGPNMTEWTAIKHLLDIAGNRRSTVRFAVQIAPYTDHFADLEPVLENLRAEVLGHPNHLRISGKPVLFWFWSGALDRKHRLIGQLRRATDGLLNIAAGLRLPVGAGEAELSDGLFAGFAPFSPLELADSDNLESVWSMGLRLADEAGMTLRVATVSPGYDDTQLSDPRRLGNPRRSVPRDHGDLFRRGFAWIEGLEPAPHLVTISTFNEFHENTHIEPTIEQGSRYLDLVRDFIASMRASQDQRP